MVISIGKKQQQQQSGRGEVQRLCPWWNSWWTEYHSYLEKLNEAFQVEWTGKLHLYFSRLVCISTRRKYWDKDLNKNVKTELFNNEKNFLLGSELHLT